MIGRRLFTTSRGRESGWVFLGALLVLTVLFILGSSLIERSQTTLSAASLDNQAARSFHLAEAGIHRALWSLNQYNGWLTYSGASATPLGDGYFTVTVSPSPINRDAITNNLTINATGYLPGPNGTQRLPRRIQAVVTKDERFFRYAIFGQNSVRIGNGTVTVKADSYDSSSGGYGGTNIRENADIGTNSTVAGGIQILPQGEVHGDITTGAGVAPSSVLDNKGTVTGSVTAAQSPVLLPSIKSVPPGATNLGDVYLDGSQTLTLNEGVYYMTDLDVLGSASITCNGKVTIYLSQTSDTGSPDVRIGGNGIVNTSGIPKNLVIYCMDDVTNIAISGAATFYGAIYAPKADIYLNSGSVHGALVGKTVTMNGATSNLHYDEALYDPANPRAVMCSWREL
ncbi:MAG: collagen-binding domain-containing protein [Armatimonadota bacterium]